MWRMRGARGEVHEERLVGHQRFLLTHPLDRLVRHVLTQVVTLLGGLLRLDRRRPFIQPRIPLVRLAADEAVEILEAAPAGGPLVERSHRARLPHRDLVAFPELRRRVAIQLHGHGQRRLVLRQDRGVARRARGNLADRAHVHRVVVAPGQKRLACGRAESRRMKAGVLQAVRREALGRRRMAGPPKRTRCGKARIVKQDDEHIWRARWRPQRRDRRKLRVRILGIVRRQTHVLRIGNRQDRPGDLFVRSGHGSSLSRPGMATRPARVVARAMPSHRSATTPINPDDDGRCLLVPAGARAARTISRPGGSQDTDPDTPRRHAQARPSRSAVFAGSRSVTIIPRARRQARLALGSAECVTQA